MPIKKDTKLNYQLSEDNYQPNLLNNKFSFFSKLKFITILLFFAILSLVIILSFKGNEINIPEHKILNQKEIEKLNPIVVNHYKSPNHVEGVLNNLFYPYKSEIIRNVDEFEFLRDALGKIDLRLVFSSNIHGDYSTDFHEKTNFFHLLVLIETENGNRFGGYTSENFTPEAVGLTSNTIEIVKPDKCAFLFNLDSKKIFEIKSDEESDALFCDDFYTINFGVEDLFIPNYFLSDESSSIFPGTYGKEAEKNELTGGESKFKIKSLEAFQVSFYSEFGDEKDKMGEHVIYSK